jgi:predicted regulator of Ras-like GTPase activity (Roadblock/LC7/MglB family)
MLPEGKILANMKCPLGELLVFTADLVVGARLFVSEGDGYILIEKGKPVAAGFLDQNMQMIGDQALHYLQQKSFLECEVITYTPQEIDQLKEYFAQEGWGILGKNEGMPSSKCSALNEEGLAYIVEQPGVIAASAFFEGFPVLSAGDGDFEQVAAIAEDLLRAASTIATDLGLGSLDQMILETSKGKFIIAPHGDLSLCVKTSSDAHLGLIRLAIRSIGGE